MEKWAQQLIKKTFFYNYFVFCLLVYIIVCSTSIKYCDSSTKSHEKNMQRQKSLSVSKTWKNAIKQIES